MIDVVPAKAGSPLSRDLPPRERRVDGGAGPRLRGDDEVVIAKT
jgi:hypothetical protein